MQIIHAYIHILDLSEVLKHRVLRSGKEHILLKCYDVEPVISWNI